MKSKKNKLVMSTITFTIAVIEYIILQVFIHCNILPEGGVDAALSMLLTSIVYVVSSAIFVKKRPRVSMWIAICAFVFLCIFLFYSKTLVDILTFVVVLFGLIVSMTMLNDKIQLQEEANKQNGGPH